VAQGKCKACAACEGCGCAKLGDGCGECAKSKKDAFASGCAHEAKPKKIKKIKHGTAQDFLIAVPPPPCMMPTPQAAPMTIYAPTPIATEITDELCKLRVPVTIYAGSPMPCPAPAAMPMPSAPAPMMVFRASGQCSQTCGEHGCDPGVQHAKHETNGVVAVGVTLGLNGCGVPILKVATNSQL